MTGSELIWLKQIRRQRYGALFVLLSLSVLLAWISFMLTSCATQITPKTNVPTSASYDHNVANSGVLGISPDGGRIVSLHFSNRYNSLIDAYGDQFNPPLKHGDGITCGKTTCTIDLQHYVDAGVMIQWKRDGRPTTPGWKKILKL